ncbi:MAG: hypothetical protein PHI34_04700 [Acidobacteriota bacterium]|nr:hypothetical protein [Acidobacteriota bacterium]
MSAISLKKALSSSGNKAVLKVITILVMIGSILAASFAGQKEQQIFAKGETALIGNRSIEHDRALQEAQRNAVEQGVGVFVNSETVTKNFKLVYDKILTKAQGYIKSYEIISERPDGDIYRVEIEAVVLLGSVQNDLAAIGLLLERKNLPRVLVLIAEENISQRGGAVFSADLSMAETTFLNKLTEKGFYCLDAKTAKASLSRERALKLIAGDQRAAQAIGLEQGAELVITGKALATPQDISDLPQMQGSGFKSARAEITARAINVDNGRILASDSHSEAGAQISEQSAGAEAIRRTSTVLADRIIARILAGWTEETSSTAVVQIHVAGLRSYSDLERFKNVLRDQIRGVESIYQREFALNSARLDVRFAGDAQMLAQDIQRTRFVFCRAYVTSASQNTIMVRIEF